MGGEQGSADVGTPYRLLTEVVGASAPIPCPDDQADPDGDSHDGYEPKGDWQLVGPQ